MTEDMLNAFTGYQPTGSARTALLIVVGLVFLTISTAITWCYGSGYKGVRLYEKMLKSFVWLIIAAFAVVVIRSALAGNINWGQLFKGFLPLELPFNDRRGFSVVMAAFAAAVGINSTFLLPYSMLARGWTREHQSLSWFDLITGTFLPFALVTSLVIIAAGSTIYDPAFFESGSTRLSPIQAAAMFESAGLNRFLARIVFGLGVLGMALTTITVHMLTCGFAVCEIFKIKPGGWGYRLACLIPAPAATGVIFWKYMGPWVAVPASAICGLLLPFAYTIFFILNNSEKYLGQDKPRGKKAFIWNILMALAIIISIISACYYIYSQFFS
jgi:hypothetical protein